MNVLSFFQHRNRYSIRSRTGRIGFLALVLSGSLSLAAPELRLQENFDSGEIRIPGAIVRTASFVDDDRGGKALDLEESDIALPMESYFDWRGGTLEFRIKYSADPKRLYRDSHRILHATGNPDRKYADAYLNSFSLIHGWGRGLFVLFGDSETRHQLVFAESNTWKAEQWMHVAITWSTGTAETLELRIYVDGRLAGQYRGAFRPDAEAWNQAATHPARPAIDRCMRIGSQGTNRVPVVLDDLRIYPFPRTYYYLTPHLEAP
ncbi:MAG: LamG-like jellyroll fold domain-containing protein [Kiritimatiellia bacterium]|nr:LamG-like jellyroll fold domain-containing protein [Kiritimatiellia bacterium]